MMLQTPKYPVYSEKSLVVSGRWRRIDHREDLLGSFPASLEIFHCKSDHPSNDRIGPHGSGESIANGLRDLKKSEARDLGLLQGTYRQVILAEQFENHLQDTLE